MQRNDCPQHSGVTGVVGARHSTLQVRLGAIFSSASLVSSLMDPAWLPPRFLGPADQSRLHSLPEGTLTAGLYPIRYSFFSTFQVFSLLFLPWYQDDIPKDFVHHFSQATPIKLSTTAAGPMAESMLVVRWARIWRECPPCRGLQHDQRLF
jgi:hypothetical protein